MVDGSLRTTRCFNAHANAVRCSNNSIYGNSTTGPSIPGPSKMSNDDCMHRYPIALIQRHPGKGIRELDGPEKHDLYYHYNRTLFAPLVCIFRPFVYAIFVASKFTGGKASASRHINAYSIIRLECYINI